MDGENKCNAKNKNNKNLLMMEEKNGENLQSEHPNNYLYPNLDDTVFSIKIAEKKEFRDMKYDGTIYDIEKQAEILKNAPYEMLPQQAFVRNFLSSQTPYNSLLLFHGLGSGKTCSAIGVCEEMREYSKQMGIKKRIIIIANPNVQDNFKIQLFDERKLTEENGIWTIKGCIGNKLLKEINPTGIKGLSREKIIQLINDLIKSSYEFYGYVEFSNEINRASGKETDKLETKIRNLTRAFENSLLVVDEVHNIRIVTDESKKNISKNLMFLANAVPNISLLLLSATPMFDNYKEIIWLLNLMNLNDRRACISISDIFDSSGAWKKDKNGKEIGKELLKRKATGYISYVRGENPYTFPFRVYPDVFAPNNTFGKIKYPKYQLNGKKIRDNDKIKKLSLFIAPIGKYQELGYNYIMDKLRNREERTKQTKEGKEKRISAFANMKSFGYNEMQLPISALNIIYYHKDLEDLAKKIKPVQFLKEYAETIDEDEGETDIKIREEESETKLEDESESESESESEDEDIDVDTLDVSPKILESINVETEDEKLEKLSDEMFGSDFEFELNPISDLSDLSDNSDKLDKSDIKGVHIIEQKTESNLPTKKNKVKSGTGLVKKGGKKEFNPSYLTGTKGLNMIMKYVDTKTPAAKGDFEYKPNVPKIFQYDEIGKYSSKIKHICDSIYDRKKDKVADGIILIYSNYINGGLVPMALALEEMGFTRYGEKSKSLFKTPPTAAVDSRTMKPPSSKTNFKPARYAMITGETRLSPDNAGDVKAITSDNNIFKEDENGNIVDISGEIIKVLLISQAGSEGLDFKAIRQVHILEPWYNINRIEQIIGRSVRNFSHKDLPFSKRNVQIFLYGTMLTNKNEEAADLYLYRKSEVKAVKIGKVTRLLKQMSVDCFINHDQTKLTADEFKKSDIEENQNIVQILSNHKRIDHFEVGDKDDSVTCDFMECEFKCLPEDSGHIKENINTYNSTFMLNTEKIIQRIKDLMSVRYFYKRNELLTLISIPKPYPKEQVYAALTQMVDDNSEYIVDKYGRSGHLINIGEYYLFQPGELNYKNISLYDRSVPIDYKHKMLNIHIKPDIEEEEKIEVAKGENNENEIFNTMFNNYMVALETRNLERANDNWYHICGVVMRKMIKENIIVSNSEIEKRDILEEFLIHHIVDSLMIDEKIELLNYVEYLKDHLPLLETNKKRRFYNTVYEYLIQKRIVAKGIIGMVIFNGLSGVNNLNVFILEDGKWNPASPEDQNTLMDVINGKNSKYKFKKDQTLDKYVGFIGFETNLKYMTFQVKDTVNKRSTGFRCDQAGKSKVIDLLNEIENDERFKSKITKESKNELCVRMELTLRSYQKQNKDNKIWFVDTETAIINEFQKKEKNK